MPTSMIGDDAPPRMRLALVIAILTAVLETPLSVCVVGEMLAVAVSVAPGNPNVSVPTPSSVWLLKLIVGAA